MALEPRWFPSLAVFARVAQLRSFSSAAREAGVAKSAVSRQVARLEDRLGVKLLRRSTRRLSLTPEGLEVYGQCEVLGHLSRAIEDTSARATREVRGVLKVNAPISLAQIALAEPLTAFLRAHPQVELQLTTDNLPVDVVEAGFDVVLRVALNRLVGATLVAKRLFSDRIVVCGAPAYLKERGVPTAPDQLLQHNCLHYALVDRAREWRGPAPGNLSSTDATLLTQAARAGLGLCVMPSFMVAAAVREGTLTVVLDGGPRRELSVNAVYAQRELPRRTRAFVEFMAAWFAQAGPRLVVPRG